MSREVVPNSPLMGDRLSEAPYQNNRPLSKGKLVIILSIIFAAILITSIIVISVRSSQAERDLIQSHNKKHHLLEQNEAENRTCPDDSPGNENSQGEAHVDSAADQERSMDSLVGQELDQAEKFKAVESVLNSKELQIFLEKNPDYNIKYGQALALLLQDRNNPDPAHTNSEVDPSPSMRMSSNLDGDAPSHKGPKKKNPVFDLNFRLLEEILPQESVGEGKEKKPVEELLEGIFTDHANGQSSASNSVPKPLEKEFDKTGVLNNVFGTGSRKVTSDEEQSSNNLSGGSDYPSTTSTTPSSGSSDSLLTTSTTPSSGSSDSLLTTSTTPSGGSNIPPSTSTTPTSQSSNSNDQSPESSAVLGNNGVGIRLIRPQQSKKEKLPSKIPYFKDITKLESNVIVKRISTDSDKKETIAPMDKESGNEDSFCHPLNTCPDNPKACYSEKEKCNGFSFCNSAFDELECTCASYLASSKLCDNFFDCPDGSDERGTCSNCTIGEVQCKHREDGTDYCVPSSEICNGYADCKDGKDEEGCFALNLEATELASDAIGSPYTNGSLYWKVEGNFYLLNVNLLHKSPDEENDIIQTFALEACNNLMPNPPSDVVVTYEVNPYNSDTHVSSKVANLESGNLNLFGNSERFTFTLSEPDETTRIISINCGEPECGVPAFTDSERRRKKREAETRIVGGEEASPTEWPFIVAIRRNGEFICGGSIITRNWIVTAAHCMLGYNNKTLNYHYEAISGMLRKNSPSVHRVSRVISEVYMYEGFVENILMHDIAVARVESPFLFNMFTAPVCLPSKDTLVDVDSVCYAVGWGNLEEDGDSAEHLQMVHIPINEGCLNDYNNITMQICGSTENGKKDACQGDSGGPLFCQHPDNSDKWFLGGIISHGIGCARPNQDGVYTRVSQYTDFISSVMNLPPVAPETGSSHLTNPDCSTHRCDGLCLPKSKLCDRNIDCIVDKSDEKYCKANDDGELTFDPPPIVERSPLNFLIKPKPVKPYIPQSSVAYPYTEPDSQPCGDGFFQCQTLYQCISEDVTCDYKADCIDHSDEFGCTCLDYLKKTNASVICDGYPDCSDWGDEVNCNFCDKGHYYCDVSDVCIPKHKLCDGESNCPKGEDERYCVHLFTTNSISIRKDGRPLKSHKGYLAYNVQGNWLPVCVRSWDKEITDKICLYMIWKGGKSYKTVSTDLEPYIKPDKVMSLHFLEGFSAFNRRTSQEDSYEKSVKNNNCRLVEVECENLPSCGVMPLYTNLGEGEDTSYGKGAFPWHITLYKNGEIACGATLLSQHWIVTHVDCAKKFDIEKGGDVLMARAGGHRNLPFHSYYDQYSRVVHLTRIPHTSVVLGMLKDPYRMDEYVNTACVHPETWVPFQQECFIAGKYGDTLNYPHKTKLIGLCDYKSDNDFVFCTQQTEKTDECMDNWSGALICPDDTGTYFAVGVYHSEKGNCHGEPAPTKFEPLVTGSVLRGIESVMKSASHSFLTEMPVKKDCTTKFCPNGKCLLENELCDHYPDCGDLSDENEYHCKYDINTCAIYNNTHCLCKHDEMLCGNGMCLDKSKYCDHVNDCGDWTDEPDDCKDCLKYLSVVNPHQICDGYVDCKGSEDVGMDEGSESCCSTDHLNLKDSEYAFKCVSGNVSYSEHNLYIPPQCINSKAVCDWNQNPEVENCYNGADEEKCFAIWSHDHLEDHHQRDTFGRYLSSSTGSGYLYFIAFGEKYLYCAGADTWTGQYREIYAKLVCQHLGFSDVDAVHIHPPKHRSRIGLGHINLTPKEDENYSRCFLIYVACLP